MKHKAILNLGTMFFALVYGFVVLRFWLKAMFNARLR
jgi:hypothetical protein